MIKRPSFLTKSKALIGLEFSAQSIQWTELSCSKNTFHLESYAHLPVKEQAAIVPALRQTIARLKPRTRQICTSVDYSSVIFKTLELDKKLSVQEIQSYLQYQAEKHFNFPPNELMLDFKILGASGSDAKLVTIQWVAAKRHELLPWLTLLTQAGLKPVIVDINSCALQRAAFFSLNELDPTAVIAVIHLYQQSFLLSIFNKNKTFLVRHEKFAVDTSAIESIARCLQLNAWRYENPISQVLLSGNLIDHQQMQKELGIEASVLSPFPEMPHSHQYAVSIGLALRCTS